MNIRKMQQLTATICDKGTNQVALGQYNALLDGKFSRQGKVLTSQYAPRRGAHIYGQKERFAEAVTRRKIAYAHPKLEDIVLEALRLYIAATGGTATIWTPCRPDNMELENIRQFHETSKSIFMAGDTLWGGSVHWTESKE